eukprot:s70_g26.t1
MLDCTQESTSLQHEPVTGTGSPETRKRHSALMAELLEKMEALQSKISSDEDPAQLRPPSFLEPVAVEPIVRPPPALAEPLTKEARSSSASPARLPRRAVKSMGNWTVEARIAQQLAEKSLGSYEFQGLAAEVRLFGTVIPDMKNFHEVSDGQRRESCYGTVPRHFLVSGLMERHELEAAFRRLDIFATPQDVADIDRFVSSPLALKELKQRFRQALQTRRQRLYRPANAGPGGRVVAPRSLSPAKVALPWDEASEIIATPENPPALRSGKMSLAIGRWRKRDDRPTPIGATPIGAKSERKVPSWTVKNTLLDTLHEKILTGSYTGAKGETYALRLLDSETANGSTWNCTRTGSDGSSKKFTIWFDESTQRVWWGSWTYYFDPAEAAASGSRINWYKLGPGKGFEWHREATDSDKVMTWTLPAQPAAEEDVPVLKEIKAYSLPGTGVLPVRTDFKPPPGLEQPAELRLFTELPEGQVSGTENCKEDTDHKADDETSAGSARSPHDTDTEQSEADERHIHSHASNWTRKSDRRHWQVKANEKTAIDPHLQESERHQRASTWQGSCTIRSETPNGDVPEMSKVTGCPPV